MPRNNRILLMYASLNDFLKKLEQNGELLRIRERVNPVLEIAEITDRFSKHAGKALLFENTGTDFPVLINAFGSEKRMSMALGVNRLDEVSERIETLFKSLLKPKDHLLDKLKMLPQLAQMASWMPKERKGRGACQEVVMKDPDITRLPVMQCWPEDGGRFITLPVIHTRDPNTGIRNVGMYRMQVFGPTLTGMHWHKHKVSARHFEAYKKLRQRMPVAVILGGDPVYTYAATAPLPDNVDEYMLAGFLRNKKVELVKCLTQDVYVPEDADFVLEGYVDPEEELIWEGPFGDHTGYYSLADWYPRFHITAITHSKNAIYPSTIVGIPPQEDAWLGKATERIFLAPIKMTLIPEILDMEMPVEGVFHNLTLVKIRKEYSGQAPKVMNAMWGAGQMMFNKMLVITDETANLQDYREMARIVSRHTDPLQDIYFSSGPMDVLDHSCSAFAFGGKMCFDATRKTPEETAAGNGPVNWSFEEPDIKSLQREFPEICGLNTSLLKDRISVVFVAVKKNRKHHIRELNEQLFRHPALRHIKFLLFLEETVVIDDLADCIWRCANNLDPRRDSYLLPARADGEPAHLGLDGTRKTPEWDDFHREWPNILAMDEATIQRVDKRWDELQLGPFLASPSRKYRKQLYGGGAVVKEPLPSS